MGRRQIWKQVLDAEIARWAALGYDELVSSLSDEKTYEITFELKTYQVEVELVEKNEQYVQVLVSVDDGSIPASFCPSFRSFVRHKGSADL